MVTAPRGSDTAVVGMLFNVGRRVGRRADWVWRAVETGLEGLEVITVRTVDTARGVDLGKSELSPAVPVFCVFLGTEGVVIMGVFIVVTSPPTVISSPWSVPSRKYPVSWAFRPFT